MSDIEIKKTVQLKTEIYGENLAAEIKKGRIYMTTGSDIICDEIEHFEALEAFVSECRKQLDILAGEE